MSDENKTPAEEPETPETGADNPTPEEQDAAETTNAIELLQADLAAMKDKAMRAVAEAENVRRRADKERADTLKYASSGLAKELLPVVDNLRRDGRSASPCLTRGQTLRAEVPVPSQTRTKKQRSTRMKGK